MTKIRLHLRFIIWSVVTKIQLHLRFWNCYKCSDSPTVLYLVVCFILYGYFYPFSFIWTIWSCIRILHCNPWTLFLLIIVYEIVTHGAHFALDWWCTTYRKFDLCNMLCGSCLKFLGPWNSEHDNRSINIMTNKSMIQPYEAHHWHILIYQ